MYVFAYGTLRPSVRPDMVSRFRLKPKPGIATLTGKFSLLNLGNFPGLIRNTDDVEHIIIGEVSEIESSTLKALDSYEGYPSLYTRDQLDVVCADGEILKAWVYLFNQDHSRYQAISSGDWTKRG